MDSRAAYFWPPLPSRCPAAPLLPLLANAPARSAPISNIRYEITFDSTTARNRLIKVMMAFDVGARTGIVVAPGLDAGGV